MARVYCSKLRRTSENSDEAKVAVVVAITKGGKGARDVRKMIETCVKEGRKWLAGEEGSVDDFHEPDEDGPMQGLGFCTWSSLGESEFIVTPVT